MKNCWLTKKDFDCEEACFECEVMRNACSIVVFCNVKECLHWRELPEKHTVEYNKNYVSFDDVNFNGICTRGEIGVSGRLLWTPQVQYSFAECKCKSDKRISGHMDFTRHLNSDGTPKGGNIG